MQMGNFIIFFLYRWRRWWPHQRWEWQEHWVPRLTKMFFFWSDVVVECNITDLSLPLYYPFLSPANGVEFQSIPKYCKKLFWRWKLKIECKRGRKFEFTFFVKSNTWFVRFCIDFMNSWMLDANIAFNSLIHWLRSAHQTAACDGYGGSDEKIKYAVDRTTPKTFSFDAIGICFFFLNLEFCCCLCVFHRRFQFNLNKFFLIDHYLLILLPRVLRPLLWFFWLCTNGRLGRTKTMCWWESV